VFLLLRASLWVEVRWCGPFALGSEARFAQPRRNRLRFRKSAKTSGGIVPLRAGWPACCWLLAAGPEPWSVKALKLEGIHGQGVGSGGFGGRGVKG